MHKRFIRGLSCLLILTILSELIPSAMFSSIIQPIHAVEMPELVQDYIVTAPYPTENGTTAEVPPTIIEGDSLSSSADGGIEETIRLTESDKQYLLLLQNTSSYSQLSTSDKQFLCTYTGSIRRHI